MFLCRALCQGQITRQQREEMQGCFKGTEGTSEHDAVVELNHSRKVTLGKNCPGPTTHRNARLIIETTPGQGLNEILEVALTG